MKRVSVKSETRSERIVASWEMLAVGQPVNTGTTWSGDKAVGVVDGGTGPVNDTTNV